MKRKRQDTNRICLQNGCHVEVQLDDAKWHPGIIVQYESDKYLVQVEQEQYWIDCDLIRKNTVVDNKRDAPFEYRPGQYLRHEMKSSDEKISPSIVDSSLTNVPDESLLSEPRKKRFTRTTNAANERKKSPFVWKANTNSSIQTRRSSKASNSPLISAEENLPIDSGHKASLSSTVPPKLVASGNVKSVGELSSSQVVIFRPVIRFFDDAINDDRQTKIASLDNTLIDIENGVKLDGDSTRNSLFQRNEYLEPPVVGSTAAPINTSNGSRVLPTSTDQSCAFNQYEARQSIMARETTNEEKSSCAIETPSPSLADVDLIEETKSPLDQREQKLKSRRKQNRPQRKRIEISEEKQDEQIKNVVHRFMLREKESNDDFSQTNNECCERGYLSDEYGEPISSENGSLTLNDLENFYRRLEHMDIPAVDEFNENSINDDDKTFHSQFLEYIHNNSDNYQFINKYRFEYYNNENDQRLRLISNILERLFKVFYHENRTNLFDFIPKEIRKHMKLCLNEVLKENRNKKKVTTRTERFLHHGKKHRNLRRKRSSIINMTNRMSNFNEDFSLDEQQSLLSPSSPFASSSPMTSEQLSTDELFSPTDVSNLVNANMMQEIGVLPRDRDVYEVIHCLCSCLVDNGFMIQCESCLCWSHCECVGVTTSCIPAFFKCSVCTNAENHRRSECALLPILDDETTSLFLTLPHNSNKTSLLLSYCRALWNLREEVNELRLRYAPRLRSLQHALRCDDLTEIFSSANWNSNESTDRLVERNKRRAHLESVADTVNEIVDRVCSSTTAYSCSFIDLGKENGGKVKPFNDQVDILLSNLSDDEETRTARCMIENRYKQLTTIVDQKIEAILLEHQTHWLSERQHFWDLIRSSFNGLLGQDIIKRVEEVAGIASAKYKGRTWIKVALMDKKLSALLRVVLSHSSLIRKFYYEDAIMSSPQMLMVVERMEDLNFIDFSFCIKRGSSTVSSLFHEDVQIDVIDITPYLSCHSKKFQNGFDAKHGYNSGLNTSVPTLATINELQPLNLPQRQMIAFDQYALEVEQRKYFEELLIRRDHELQRLKVRIEALQNDREREVVLMENMILELQSDLQSVREHGKFQDKTLMQAGSATLVNTTLESHRQAVSSSRLANSAEDQNDDPQIHPIAVQLACEAYKATQHCDAHGAEMSDKSNGHSHNCLCHSNAIADASATKEHPHEPVDTIKTDGNLQKTELVNTELVLGCTSVPGIVLLSCLNDDAKVEQQMEYGIETSNSVTAQQSDTIQTNDIRSRTYNSSSHNLNWKHRRKRLIVVPMSTPYEIVHAANCRFEELFNNGKIDELVSLYAEEASLLPPDKNQYRGRDQIKQFWQSAREAGVNNVALRTGTVIEAGHDRLIETGSYQHALDRGNYQVIWKRVHASNDNWQLEIDIFN